MADATEPRAPGALIENLATATFECTFGRGCDGVCCRNGRPPVDDDDIFRIAEALPRVLERLRPAARAAILRRGFLTARVKAGRPMLRTVEGWCVFFNRGCEMHRLGVEDGDRFRHKPFVCAVFPLDQDAAGRWRVRQRGYRGERWALTCLDPAASTRPAAETLRDEIAVVMRETGADD